MRNSDSRLRVIVTGLVGLHPLGGVAWDYLQYVIGLARLGHDVYYHEDTWSWPYHPIEKRQTSAPDYSIDYIRRFFSTYLPDRPDCWHYRHLHETSHGISEKDFIEISRSADIFLNISGASIFPDQLSPECLKVFVDTDPGYNQIVLSEKFAWSENVERWCETVAAHDYHFTYAENIHAQDCLVPRLDYDWKPTRMPVVTELWADSIRASPPSRAPWTTVMTWNAFKGALVYKGREYKSKGSEFERFITLPQHIDTPMKLALGGMNAPMEKLTQHGWRVVDGPAATVTPEQYLSFIEDSRGEFSTAKHVYVALRTGWFSCRTACYLAAGRPAVIQDTGFSKLIPCGNGLLCFTSLEEAIEGLRRVESNYLHHQAAAREIAGEYFASERVLTAMLSRIGPG